MKCYSCMRKVDNQARVCPHCGAKLVMDREMLDKAKRGDQDTLAVLYSMAYDPMLQAANDVLHNSFDAEDAAMDAVGTMLERIGQLDMPESFIPWAKQIASNKAKDYVKKKKPVLIGESDEEDSADFWENLEEVDTSTMPEISLEREENDRLVRNAMEALGPDLYNVLKCVYVDEMKLSEIAEQYGVNLNTIKTRKRTAEKKMYEWAKGEEKKGIYLHSMSPIVYWLWLLRGTNGGGGLSLDPNLANRLTEGVAAASNAAPAASTLVEQAASSGILQHMVQGISQIAQTVSSGAAELFSTTAARIVAIVAASVIGVAGVGGAIVHETQKHHRVPLEADSQENEESFEDSFQELSLVADPSSVGDQAPAGSVVNSTAKQEESSVQEENSVIPSTVNVTYFANGRTASARIIWTSGCFGYDIRILIPMKYGIPLKRCMSRKPSV